MGLSDEKKKQINKCLDEAKEEMNELKALEFMNYWGQTPQEIWSFAQRFHGRVPFILEQNQNDIENIVKGFSQFEQFAYDKTANEKLALMYAAAEMYMATNTEPTEEENESA